MGIEERCNDHGYSVFLANSNADPERERKVVQSFPERRVDGIVVTSSRVGALYVPMLSEMRVPIVLVNNQQAGEFVHSVMIDNVQGSREATNHLIELGSSAHRLFGRSLWSSIRYRTFFWLSPQLSIKRGIPFLSGIGCARRR